MLTSVSKRMSISAGRPCLPRGGGLDFDARFLHLAHARWRSPAACPSRDGSTPPVTRPITQVASRFRELFQMPSSESISRSPSGCPAKNESS